MGHASKYEVRLRVDEDGNYATDEHGGKLPPKVPVMTVKYEKEARGHFIVCVVPDEVVGGKGGDVQGREGA